MPCRCKPRGPSKNTQNCWNQGLNTWTLCSLSWIPGRPIRPRTTSGRMKWGIERTTNRDIRWQQDTGQQHFNLPDMSSVRVVQKPAKKTAMAMSVTNYRPVIAGVSTGILCVRTPHPFACLNMVIVLLYSYRFTRLWGCMT